MSKQIQNEEKEKESWRVKNGDEVDLGSDQMLQDRPIKERNKL